MTVHSSADCWWAKDCTYLMLHIFPPTNQYACTNYYACLATNQVDAGCEKVTETRE